MVRSYAFLWREQDIWHVQLPYGPAGSGPTQEAALATLREALRERDREIRSRPQPESPYDERLRKLLPTKSSEEYERERMAEIDRFGLDDCLLIAPQAFAALLEARCTRRTDREFRRSIDLTRRLRHEAPRPVRSVSDRFLESWLRRHRIVWISSEIYDLPVYSHWLADQTGLFAFDGSTLIPLDGRVENLQALFQAEQPLLDDVAPACVAELIAEAIGRRGNAHHSLATVHSLERMEEEKVGGYVLDRRELARISPLPAASLESSADGWILRFVTSFGELGMDDDVYEWRVEISRRFEVQVRADLLSSRIWASRPFVME